MLTVDGISLGARVADFLDSSVWEDLSGGQQRYFARNSDDRDVGTVVEMNVDGSVLVTGLELSEGNTILLSRGDSLGKTLEILGNDFSASYLKTDRLLDYPSRGIIVYLEADNDVVEVIAIRPPSLR